jgi:branched-chain amino acid transport system permease protein
MTPEISLLLVQDGLSNGAIYTLLAVALILVYSVTRIIFIPQGEFVAFGALTLASLEAGKIAPTLYMQLVLAALVLALEGMLHLRGERVRVVSTAIWAIACPLVATLACLAGRFDSALMQVAGTLLIVIPMGPLLYRLVYRPIAHAPVLTLLIASMALHIVLVGVGLFLFGPEGVRTTPILDARITLGGLAITAQSLVVIVVSAGIASVLFAFFRRTLMGKALRAAAMNSTGARIVGIPIELSSEMAVAIAAAIGVASGVLIGPLTTTYYDSGFLVGLKGFVAAIMGGLGGYAVASIGALGVGVAESFCSFWSSAYKEALVFSLIIPVLWWRSRGVHHVGEND